MSEAEVRKCMYDEVLLFADVAAAAAAAAATKDEPGGVKHAAQKNAEK